jgi:hypothetical protein
MSAIRANDAPAEGHSAQRALAEASALKFTCSRSGPKRNGGWLRALGPPSTRYLRQRINFTRNVFHVSRAYEVPRPMGFPSRCASAGTEPTLPVGFPLMAFPDWAPRGVPYEGLSRNRHTG